MLWQFIGKFRFQQARSFVAEEMGPLSESARRVTRGSHRWVD
jgi:hypothetical protein